MAALETGDHGRGIDECSAAGVDDHHAWFHSCDGLRVDDVPGLQRQGSVQRDDIGPSPDLVEWDVLDSHRPAFLVWHEVVRDYPAAETEKNPGDNRSDLAG